MGDLICELERSTVDDDRAAIFVAEFFVWWHQAGRFYYNRGRPAIDGGLRAFAEESVLALGGWRAARQTLLSQGRIRRKDLEQL